MVVLGGRAWNGQGTGGGGNRIDVMLSVMRVTLLTIGRWVLVYLLDVGQRIRVGAADGARRFPSEVL